jgi:hypothetical protein
MTCDAEDLRKREAMIMAIIADARPSVGVALSRKWGRPTFQPPSSSPAPKLPGPKQETQWKRQQRDAMIYRLWRQHYSRLGATAFAQHFVNSNTTYLASSYQADARHGEPPLDQSKRVSFLIRRSGLAVPSASALRNRLGELHKNSGHSDPG